MPQSASTAHVVLHRLSRVAAIAALLAGCNSSEPATEAPRDAPAPSPPAAAAAPVDLAADAPAAAAQATTEATAGGGVIELAGDLRPEQAADLAFKIGGQLAALKVARGQHVKKGQLLAALSDLEARAQLAQADAAVAQAEAQLALARDGEGRANALAAANAAPGSQAIAVRLQPEAAQAGVLQARAARDLAGAALGNH